MSPLRTRFGNPFETDLGLRKRNEIANRFRNEKRMTFNSAMTMFNKVKCRPIDHEGTFKSVWESIKLILAIYQLIYLPLAMSMFSEVPWNIFAYFDVFCDLFTIADICLTFVTQIIIQGEIEFYFKRIAIRYLQTWFIPDLLSILPLDKIVAANIVEDKRAMLFLPDYNRTYLSKSQRELWHRITFFKLIKLIRILRVLKFFSFLTSEDEVNYFKIFLDKYLRDNVLYTMIPNFCMLICSVHYLACFWYGFVIFGDERNNWEQVNKRQKKALFDKYIDSLYVVIQTFTSTGYGDFISKTNGELAFRIVTIIIGAIVYGLFTGQVMDYRAKSTERDELLAIKLTALEKLKRDFGIDDSLYQEVTEALRYEKNKPRRKYNLSILSTEDRNDFLYLKYMSKFRSLKLFTPSQEGQAFAILLGNSMEARRFERGDLIYASGQPALHLFVIYMGSVRLQHPSVPNVPFLSIKSGMFGEYEIMRNLYREFTAVAETDCLLYVVQASIAKRLFLDHFNPGRPMEFIAFVNSRHERIIEAYKTFSKTIVIKCFWRIVFKHAKKGKKKIDFIKMFQINDNRSNKDQ